MTKRVTLLALSFAALGVGVAYILVAHPSGVVSMTMIGLPLALLVCSWPSLVSGKEVALCVRLFAVFAVM